MRAYTPFSLDWAKETTTRVNRQPTKWEKIKKIREIIKQDLINKRISENKTMKLQNK